MHQYHMYTVLTKGKEFKVLLTPYLNVLYKSNDSASRFVLVHLCSEDSGASEVGGERSYLAQKCGRARKNAEISF